MILHIRIDKIFYLFTPVFRDCAIILLIILAGVYIVLTTVASKTLEQVSLCLSANPLGSNVLLAIFSSKKGIL